MNLMAQAIFWSVIVMAIVLTQCEDEKGRTLLGTLNDHLTNEVTP